MPVGALCFFALCSCNLSGSLNFSIHISQINSESVGSLSAEFIFPLEEDDDDNTLYFYTTFINIFSFIKKYRPSCIWHPLIICDYFRLERPVYDECYYNPIFMIVCASSENRKKKT